MIEGPPPRPEGDASNSSLTLWPAGAVARESLIRLGADAAALLAGVVASILIARVLGPVAKGDYATVIYLVGLFAAASTMGLGDANIILVSQNAFRLSEAVRYSGTVVLLLSVLVAVPALAGCAFLLFQDDWTELSSSVWLAALAVPFTALSNLATTSLLARQRVVLTSAVLVASSWTITVWIALFLGILQGGVPEAILASVAGSVISLSVAGVGLMREGWRPSVGLSRTYALRGLKLGLPLQAASMLTLMSARVDLLLVHGFLGSGPAGQYSVSLMLGQLVLYAPFALALVTFPRLAKGSLEQTRDMATAVFRASLIISVTVAVGLAIATPILIPLVFGSQFEPAVAPALLLIFGGIAWCEQWTLARAEAARGRPSLLFVSSAAAVVTMLLADAILIPGFGLLGAAIASNTAAAVGLLVCIQRMQRSDWQLTWSELIPAKEDLARLLSTVRRRR